MCRRWPSIPAHPCRQWRRCAPAAISSTAGALGPSALRGRPSWWCRQDGLTAQRPSARSCQATGAAATASQPTAREEFRLAWLSSITPWPAICSMTHSVPVSDGATSCAIRESATARYAGSESGAFAPFAATWSSILKFFGSNMAELQGGKVVPGKERKNASKAVESSVSEAKKDALQIGEGASMPRLNVDCRRPRSAVPANAQRPVAEPRSSPSCRQRSACRQAACASRWRCVPALAGQVAPS